MFRKTFLYGLVVVLSIPAFSQQKQRFQNLQQAIAATGQLAGSQGPSSVNWIDGGNRFSYIGANNSIRSFSPKDQREEVVFDGSQLKFPGTGQTFAYESFQWSKDSKYILFQSNFRPVWRRSGLSDFYMYAVADKSLKLVAKDAQTAELSPDGSRIGYERDGNLFIFDFASQKETQLTNDAAPSLYNGRFGWAYEEEFGLAQAWEWSPDSKFIAYWQIDERQVPIYAMTDYKGFDENFTKLPYPRVGDKNPTARIGVIEIGNRQQQWMKVDLADGYIPRIYWTSQEGQLALVHLNRKQNDLKLFLANARTGDAKQIMEEKSKAWVDVFDFFAGIMHYFYFPANSQEFFWVSERDGWAHIYRYDYSGKLLNQVTKGNWEVVFVHNVDAKSRKIYYTSTEQSPTDRQLYVVDFDGKNKQKLTQAPGRHKIDFSPGSQYYIDRFSNVTTPLQVELRDTKGAKIKTLESNAAVSQFLSSYAYVPKELSGFTTSDGQKIDISIIKPLNFDPTKKYPAVLDIYGGPGAQSVYNEFSTTGWHQYLAQQGYVIVSVNNRGSGGYGYRFEKVVYEKLGQFESLDFVETAKHLATLPWIDAGRIAIRGHSYGGYMSSYTMLAHPGIFKVSIVGAPVTDWRLYDSIYTERYMGLLPENEALYQKSAVSPNAKNLKGKMFIAHSTMDENVHVRNTMQLMNALEDAGKDADLRIYPPGAHGVAYSGTSSLLLYQQYTDYLERYLKN
ncbi:S9 family peptidase [Larkinella terrae]|uniref:Prolyl oligopeptidase family serine peptidase n=1 Tax=Larkinella terrae TaxID=2025311 RepID=A0A7K0EVJ7_9BACT|nr:S9 family peptidase [Larkinella terrae]MRS65596.1 prolyl oligopeptidase family serine peptidase [Larkinella terrae]